MMFNYNYLGHASLNISAAVYMLYFIPQLLRNAKRRRLARISGLQLPTVSWGLQLCYVIGASADLLYGFGLHLPWQYCAVSLSVMLSLCVQQYQLRPMLGKDYRPYIMLCAVCGGAVATCMLLFLCYPRHSILIIAGILSTACYWVAFVPQLVRNFILKNGAALSCIFIALTMTTAVLDMISALCLHWPWPSLVGPPVIFFTHVIALWQYHYWSDQRTSGRHFAHS